MKSWILNCEVKGSGDTLVLIHGVAGSLHIWDPVFEELAKTHRVVRVDLLGYGHSPKPRMTYTPRLHVKAIKNTLNDLGITSFTIIGLSMGASIALEYTSMFPDDVKGFIGIGLPYYKNEASARKGLHNNTWARLAIEHPFISPFIVQPIWTLGRYNILPAAKFSKIYTPLMARETLMNPFHIFQSNVFNCMVLNPQTQLLKESGNMDRLFIHGENDEWQTPTVVQSTLESYPNSTLKLVNGTAHNVVVIQPKETLSLIQDYLERH